MSENRAKYIIEGVDNVSAPFRAAQHAAEGLERAMQRLGAAMSAMAQASAQAAHSAQATARAATEAARAARRAPRAAGGGSSRGGGRGIDTLAAFGRGGADRDRLPTVANARTPRGRQATWRTNVWTLSHMVNLGRAAVGVAQEIGGIAAEAGSVAVSVGSALADEATFQQRTLGSLTQAFGNATEARREFQASVRLAAQTPLSIRDFTEIGSNLARYGIRGRQADQMRAFLSDIASSQGTEAAQLGLRGIGQMFSRGRASEDNARQVYENLGLSRQAILATVGRNRGRTGTDEALARAMEAEQGHGRVTANEYLTASMQTFARGGRSQGAMRELGSVTAEQGQGLAGQLSNFRDIWSTLNQSRDLSKDAGLQTLTRALRNVNAILTDTNGLGGRLIRLIEGVSRDVFGALFGDLANRQNAEQSLGRVVGMMEQLRPTIAGVAQEVRAFATSFGTAFQESWQAWRSIHGSDTSGVDRQRGAFASLATVLGQVSAFLLEITTRYREVARAFEVMHGVGNAVMNPVGAMTNAVSNGLGLGVDEQTTARIQQAQERQHEAEVIMAGLRDFQQRQQQRAMVQNNTITVQAAPDQAPQAVGAAVGQAARAGIAARGG